LAKAAGSHFTLKRISGTLKVLVKNKMALVGLVLLFSFVFIALAAPLLTSYNPGATVSGELAQPDWVMNFPDGYYLSKNLAEPATNTFTSPASIQQWTLSASPATLANVQESYAPHVNFTSASQGSLQLSYTGNSPGTVRVFETFQFPYRGPPDRFIANIHYLLSGATNSTPVNVKVFIERSQTPTAQDYFLVNENDSANGVWMPTATAPVSTLDSKNLALGQFLGLPLNTNPTQIIFSQATSYSYGIQVTFYGHQTVNVDDFRIQLLGTAFGLMGTDYSGADVFTQTVYGSRISLFVGLLSAGIGIGIGLVVGLLAGFLGKIVDETLMRFTDMMLVIPSLPLLIVLVAVIGPSILNIIIVIGFLGWMGFARIIRAQVLTLRERPFIEAARASGAGPGRIIVKHVFPNIVSLTYVNLALSVPAAILTEAALAFLGLSDPSVISWGHMFYTVEVSGTLSHFPPAWWWVLPPGFGIALVSLSFILIGYALDEIFNPRLRKRR